MPSCIEWGEERHQDCTRYEDRGYNDCADWNPLVAWLCITWVWVSSVVCVAWTWVTTAVCVVWDTVTTTVNAVLVIGHALIGWVFDILALVIEVILAIPIIGALVRWVWNFITFVFWTIASLGDALLGLVGVRPEKILRICSVILLDEKGQPVASTQQVIDWLQLACNVYKRDANVRIIPVAPFKFTTGFLGPETVDPSWVQTHTRAGTSDILDLPCGESNGLADFWLVGSKIQLLTATYCKWGAFRRSIGYGGPLTCLIIRSIPNAGGCSLWITDYMTISATQGTPRVIAHEAGHSCNLWHTCSDNNIWNLMATTTACFGGGSQIPVYTNPGIQDWQVLLVRASKHVTYF